VRIKTLEQAAAWVEDVGLALLFPNGDYVLPSLWEAVAGHTVVDWAVRDEEGKYVSFTPEMDKVWGWKDELPRRRLACVGLHVARTSSLVAPRLVSAVYAVTGRAGTADDFRAAELEGLELEVAEAALELGRPTTRRELRLLVGADKRRTDHAVNALQRKLVLTNAGLSEEGSGWASTLHDLFARRWKARLRRVPPREEAVRALAAAVVRGAGEVSAETHGLAEPRSTGEITLYVSPARATAAAGRGSTSRSRAAGSRSSPRRSR
jgi:hypothetical protein